jgi:hypothetical protein
MKRNHLCYCFLKFIRIHLTNKFTLKSLKFTRKKFFEEKKLPLLFLEVLEDQQIQLNITKSVSLSDLFLFLVVFED